MRGPGRAAIGSAGLATVSTHEADAGRNEINMVPGAAGREVGDALPARAAVSRAPMVGTA